MRGQSLFKILMIHHVFFYFKTERNNYKSVRTSMCVLVHSSQLNGYSMRVRSLSCIWYLLLWILFLHGYFWRERLWRLLWRRGSRGKRLLLLFPTQPKNDAKSHCLPSNILCYLSTRGYLFLSFKEKIQFI